MVRLAGLSCMGALLAASCGGADNPLAGEPTTTSGASTELIVAEFSESADLSDLGGATDWADRGSTVVERLKATAETSQRDARTFADEAGLDATSYWVTNVMVFEGDADLAKKVAELPGVDSVYLEPLHPHITDAAFESVDAADVPATTRNVAAVGRLPDAWADGHDGSGAVIGVIDTGVDVTHPALAIELVRRRQLVRRDGRVRGRPVRSGRPRDPCHGHRRGW